MANTTVVLDGTEQLNINESADAQVVTCDGSGEILIVQDGEAGMVLTEEAGAAVITADGEADVVTEIHTADLPWYDGPTEITPSEERQVLQTVDHAVSTNIVVSPIPSNYGRIAWNGSRLTVY